MTPTIKLQAYLSHQGVASRRKAETLISEGKVLVDNKPAHIGQRVTGSEQITVKGQLVKPKTEDAYWLVYKPKGIVSTTSDELHRRTILDLLPKKIAGIHPVGRLDKDSEGLVLLTTDGEVTFKLTHPKFEKEKKYKVKVAGKPTYKALAHLERGVKLKEGYTKPAQVAVLESNIKYSWLEITISEGKNHQIRRMMERVGYEVIELIRTEMGILTLDWLQDKKVRQLEPDEIEELKASL